MRRNATLLLASVTTVATALTAAPPKPDALIAVELVPASSGFASTQAVAIDKRGGIIVQVLGAEGGVTRSLLWSDGGLADLGNWAAQGINDRGQIVGSMPTATVPHAALWEDGRLTDLHPPTPPGYTSTAVAISDSGLIAGYGTYREGTHYCPCSQFLLWDRGAVQELGVYPNENNGDNTARATAINARGDLVGYSTDYDPATRTRAVLWDRGEWTDLGGLTATGASQALGLNKRGDIAGWSEDASHVPHAVVWVGSRIVDLGSPGRATAINEHGDVAGWLQVPDGRGHTYTRAFVWDGRTLTELPPLAGSPNSAALAISDRGDVVGYSTTDGATPHPRATLWPRKGRDTSSD